MSGQSCSKLSGLRCITVRARSRSLTWPCMTWTNLPPGPNRRSRIVDIVAVFEGHVPVEQAFRLGPPAPLLGPVTVALGALQAVESDDPDQGAVVGHAGRAAAADRSHLERVRSATCRERPLIADESLTFPLITCTKHDYPPSFDSREHGQRHGAFRVGRAGCSGPPLERWPSPNA